MRASSELSASSSAPEALEGRRRARAFALQEAALPGGATVVSCPAPLDSGGLGRHLREILEALARGGRPNASVRVRSDAAPERGGDVQLQPGWRATLATPLARTSRAWRMWATCVDFDASAARRLPAGEHLIAFNGAAGAQLRAAGAAGFQSRSLVSANSHFRQVITRHELAHRQYPIERPWVSRLLSRNLAEYALAQQIYVSSEYIRESFLREGHAEESLTFFPLTPHPRFQPAAAPSGGAPRAERSSTFDIVYVGSLLVHKGVPLLVDALSRLPYADIRLVLVGGWGTRPMRRFVEGAQQRDPRISVAPGDPLERLRRARLCVHPAYEDGFGYAPAEALACGVPVIVSEDTGMKELIARGRDGVVLPTGELDALTESIEAAYRGELVRA